MYWKNFPKSKMFIAARNKANKPVTTREEKYHTPNQQKNLNLATNTKHLHRMGDRIILFYPHASQSLCSHVSDIIQKCFQYGHFHSLTSEAFYCKKNPKKSRKYI